MGAEAEPAHNRPNSTKADRNLVLWMLQTLALNLDERDPQQRHAGLARYGGGLVASVTEIRAAHQRPTRHTDLA